MTKPYHIPVETSFVLIDCEKAFSGLNEQQSLYAYNFAKASWSGAKVSYFERSYESPAMLYLILKAFQGNESKKIEDTVKDHIPEGELKRLFVYIAAFVNNCGNFKSFGDSKFVPQCSQENFEKFFKLNPYWKENLQEFERIYSKIRKYIFAHEKPYELINFGDKEGTTGYYSGNVTSEEAEKVKEITIKNNLMSENDRLIKVKENEFVVKVASIEEKETVIEQNGIKVTFKYGEFSRVMADVNRYLTEAQKHSANDAQRNMIKHYIEHFKTGDMQLHKESQKEWIKDVGPVVQTNIGFIESYLDPLKIRAEFEGFVSVVNKEESQLLNKLVESAPKTLQYLTWGKQFEVEVFRKPDFTSLDVLAFASSGVPVGINIPNYNDIRENFGFKNVNLGNAYGEPTKQSMQYTPLDQVDLCLKYYKPSLFVLVALHELLGHGSGRLLKSAPQFKSPLDGSEITTFYKENENHHSVFGEVASTYEQCKADCVGLYLSLFQDVQEILLPSYSQQERWDIVYVEWLDLIVSGLRGLIYFDVEGKKWLQAHVGASWAILKVLEEEGGIFEIKETERNGKPYLEVHMDKENFKTKGKNAIGVFLQHLQIYKSTADAKRGNAYFNKYLEVSEKYLKYREIIQANKRPRRIDVQSDVKIVNGKVEYIRFEPNVYGCIDAAVSHFGENSHDLIEEWDKNNQQFQY